MEALAGALARLNRAEADIELNSKYRHEMRGEMNRQDRELAVIKAGQTEIREDVAEVKDQLKWVLRGLVGAIVTFTGLIITILVAVFSNV